MPGDAYPEGYFDSIVDDQKLLSQFYNESTEHLEQAQIILLELEYDSTNKEFINNIFRNFHTIKGSSAFLGLKNIEEISHSIEDLIDLVRESKLNITKELLDVIFYGIELIKTILDTMEICNYQKENMKKEFEQIKIFDYIELMRKIKKEYEIKKIGEILVEFGKITLNQLDQVLLKQKEKKDKKVGEIIIEENIAKPEDVIYALDKQKEQKLRSRRINYVKVSNDRLNTLIDIVGELVTNQSMLKQQIEQADIRSQELERGLTDFENITRMIKNIVLSMGMSPIEEIFNKLKIVARNTANELGKLVFVKVEGGETELDRNVMEFIYDPLIHLVRNAIDHGIEVPEEREKMGKNKVGMIILKAEHKGSGIEITVKDDGRGIDINKIIQRAIEMNLIENKEKVKEKDVYNLLFLPGFSTSNNITKVSGRGVGLDIVKKNIEQIHGKVEIISEAGRGTSFIIKLPLTLAIIEGFVFKEKGMKYIIPFNMIDEILVIDKKNIIENRENEKTNYILYHRGMHIPIIVLKGSYENRIKGNEGIILSIIVNYNDSKYCIIVEEIIGKQEIVIKNLGGILNRHKIFSGGTIFGDGTIGFVIDMQGLIESQNR